VISLEPEPKVSVIIPVYNGEKTLAMCLNSVLNQTYKNYEVIVVDNNSKDRTKEIIYNFRDKNNRIKYTFAERRSSGIARNEGIKAAQGDILAFTDADCICPFNWIVEITRPIRLEKEEATVGFEEDLIKNYWTKNMQKRDDIYMRRSSDGKYIRTFDGKNAAIRMGLIRELMFDPDIGMMSDLDLAVRITMEGRILYLPSVRVGHFHRSSLKSTIKTYFVRSFWSPRIYRKYKKDNYIRKYIMFESMDPKNWLLFPFWMLFQFIKRPASEAFFILVTELSWRAGVLWSIILSVIK
jgi:glycosyltransferase involved in cell wall biosynthesis